MSISAYRSPQSWFYWTLTLRCSRRVWRRVYFFSHPSTGHWYLPFAPCGPGIYPVGKLRVETFCEGFPFNVAFITSDGLTVVGAFSPASTLGNVKLFDLRWFIFSGVQSLRMLCISADGSGGNDRRPMILGGTGLMRHSVLAFGSISS